MTQFVAVPGEDKVFVQSFLQQLVSINFPGGVILRIIFGASSAGNAAAAFNSVISGMAIGNINVQLQFTGLPKAFPSNTGVAVVDPPTSDMLTKLTAWEVVVGEVPGIYVNVGKMLTLGKQQNPLVLTLKTAALAGLPSHTSDQSSINNPPELLGQPVIVLDSTQPIVQSDVQLASLMHSAGLGIPPLFANDGGDASRAAAIVSLANNDHGSPGTPGPDNWFGFISEFGQGATFTTKHIVIPETDAAWTLELDLYDIKTAPGQGGSTTKTLNKLKTLKDSAKALNLGPSTITIVADAAKKTLTETK
jgi:hypothetical protein